MSLAYCPIAKIRWSETAPLRCYGLNASCGTIPACHRCRDGQHVVNGGLRSEAELNNSQQWLALDIEAGIPVIDAAGTAVSLALSPGD